MLYTSSTINLISAVVDQDFKLKVLQPYAWHVVNFMALKNLYRPEPMGLNSHRVSVFQFSYFMFLRYTSGISRNSTA